MARSIAAGVVRPSGTTSTTGISSGGFRGWVTRQRSSRRQRPKISIGIRLLEELVSRASGPATCSRAANSFCLASGSSTIASTIQSASCTASTRVCAWLSSSRPRSTMPWVARSRATSARARRATSPRARSAAPALVSNIATGQPADAHSAAHPMPISPAPITATLRGRVIRRPPRPPARAGRARTAAGAPARGGLPLPRARGRPPGPRGCGPCCRPRRGPRPGAGRGT